MTEPIIRAGWELQGKYLAEDIVWKASAEQKKGLPKEAPVPFGVSPDKAGRYLENIYGTPVFCYRKKTSSPKGFCIYTPCGTIRASFSCDEDHPGVFLTCIGEDGHGPGVLMEYTEDPSETAKGPRVHALVWTREDPDGKPRFDLAMSPEEDG